MSMGFDLPTGLLNDTTLCMKIRVIGGGFASLATPPAVTIPTVAEELVCIFNIA